jgi:diaminopimelate decarboxylase/aspartate kinase
VSAWWQTRTDELLEVAAAGLPVWVLEQGSVEVAARGLKRQPLVERTCYRVGANAHPDVLRWVRRAGLWFCCDTVDALFALRALFPKLGLDRVVYSPESAPMEDYAAALVAGVAVTVHGAEAFEAWPEVFTGQSVMLRLQPGQTPADYARMAALAAAAGAQIVGLHGAEVSAGAFAAALGSFPTARVLNLGATGSPAQVRAAVPDLAIWLEPGAAVVAAAGVRLSAERAPGGVQIGGGVTLEADAGAWGALPAERIALL